MESVFINDMISPFARINASLTADVSGKSRTLLQRCASQRLEEYRITMHTIMHGALAIKDAFIARYRFE
jgi:hypothetical protein